MSRSAPSGRLTEPRRLVPLALLGALVMSLTVVVLWRLPRPSTWHMNHGAVTVVADELARSALVVVAAVAAVTGGLRWRRWAAATAALHVLGVGLRWAQTAGPGGFARIEVWRGSVVGALAVAAGITARPLWVGAGRRRGSAAVALLAAVSTLGGLRRAIPLGQAPPPLLDGVRTGGGLAVVVAGLAAAVLIARVDDAALAGAHLIGVGVVAAAALVGDLASWWGEGRPGSVEVLSIRLVLALAPCVVGVATLARRAGRAGRPGRAGRAASGSATSAGGAANAPSR